MLASALVLTSGPASALASVLTKTQAAVPSWTQTLVLPSTLVLASVPAAVLASVLT